MINKVISTQYINLYKRQDQLLKKSKPDIKAPQNIQDIVTISKEAKDILLKIKKHKLKNE